MQISLMNCQNKSRSAKKVITTIMTAQLLFFISPSAYANEMTYGPPNEEVGQKADSPDADKDRYKAAAQVSPDPGKKKLLAMLEISYQALNALDAAETISCVKKTYCVEENPILGKKPSTGAIMAFKLAVGTIHYLGYRYEIKKSQHTALIFEVATNAIQGVVSGLNLRYAF